MKLVIFAKKCESRDGKKFYRYLTTLTDKQGNEYPAQVKFREACGSPRADKCPMYIIVSKQDANLNTREYTKEDTGEIRQSRTLWVSAWTDGGEYIDTSLDDFED